MAEIRRRQVPFRNPILFPEVEGEFEKDPERALWVPGRKTFFLPTQRQVEFVFGIDWGKMLSEEIRSVSRRSLVLNRVDFYEMLRDCSPSRSAGITYGEIQRSTVPAFRSRRFNERW